MAFLVVFYLMAHTLNFTEFLPFVLNTFVVAVNLCFSHFYFANFDSLLLFGSSRVGGVRICCYFFSGS